MTGKRALHLGSQRHVVYWKPTQTVLADEMRAPAGQAWLARVEAGWGEGKATVTFTYGKANRAGRRGAHATKRVELAVVSLPPKKNLVVDVGIQRSLDRLFNRNGPPGPVITIGIDNGASNPTSATTSSTTGSTSRRLVALVNLSRTGNVISCEGTFTQANANFIYKRLFLSAAAAGTTDAAGDLYSMTNAFTHDNVTGAPFSTWSQTYQATVTGVGA